MCSDVAHVLIVFLVVWMAEVKRLPHSRSVDGGVDDAGFDDDGCDDDVSMTYQSGKTTGERPAAAAMYYTILVLNAVSTEYGGAVKESCI